MGVVVSDRLAYWQRRARDAERQLGFEVKYNLQTTAWAHEAFDEQRRLGDRLTYVCAVAIAHGATWDDIKGPT